MYARYAFFPRDSPSLIHIQDQYDPFRDNDENPDRLAIVDPNRADNNVSGGTAEINLILRCFRQAYSDLQMQLTSREQSGSRSSLLSDVLGGDYAAYARQRERLRSLHSNRHPPGNRPLPPSISLHGPPGVALPNITAAARQQSTMAKGSSTDASY